MTMPSTNLKRIQDDLESGDLAKLKVLSAKIEAGNGQADEAELESVYDGFVVLMATVEDLADMCRRREEALGENGIVYG